MSTVIEELVGTLGWKIDSKAVDQFEKQSKQVISTVGKMTAALTGAAVGAFYAVSRINETTAANYRLAQSVGVTYDWLDTWADAASHAGITAETLTKSVDYLSKRFGEAKIEGGAQAEELNRYLKTLNLSYDQLANAEAGTRFSAVVHGLASISDETQRAAAASRLLGRQGGIAFVRMARLAEQSGMSLDEYLARYDAVEFETERTARGALEFSNRLDTLKIAAGNVKQAFAGLVGEALSPLLQATIDWIKANRELIKIQLAKWADRIARFIEKVFSIIKKLYGILAKVIDRLGGFENLISLIAILFAGKWLAKFGGFVVTLSKISGIKLGRNILDWLKSVAGPTGLAVIATAAFEDLYKSIDDLSNKTVGNYFGRILAKEIDGITASVLKFLGVSEKNLPKAVEQFKFMFSRLTDFDFIISNGSKAFDMWISGIERRVVLFIATLRGAVQKVATEFPILGSMLRAITPSAPTIAPTPRVAPAQPSASISNSSSTRYYNNTVNAPITIQAPAGASPREIGRAVRQELDRTMQRTLRTQGAY